MSLLITFFKVLPDLITLLQVLQKRIDEAEIDRKVADDVKAIHEAFTTKDPAKLSAIFNSK